MSFAADELFATLLKRLEDPKELLMVDALVAAPRVYGFEFEEKTIKMMKTSIMR